MINKEKAKEVHQQIDELIELVKVELHEKAEELAKSTKTIDDFFQKKGNYCIAKIIFHNYTTNTPPFFPLSSEAKQLSKELKPYI